MENWGEQTRLVFRLAVGLYLIYLAYQIITAQLSGGTDMPDLVAYGGGGILGLAGIAFCDFAVMRYFKHRKANRDSRSCPEDEDKKP